MPGICTDNCVFELIIHFALDIQLFMVRLLSLPLILLPFCMELENSHFQSQSEQLDEKFLSKVNMLIR